MSKSAIVLDTNILIEVSKQQFNPSSLLGSYRTVLISIVSWTEAMGFNFPNTAEQARMEFFLRGLLVLPFTMAEAQHAIAYRKLKKIKFPDAAILATARAAGADLLTQNTADFRGLDAAVRVLTMQEL